MAYTKTNWQDGTTPVDASNLNKIENALSDQDSRIDENADANKMAYFTLNQSYATNLNSGDDLNDCLTVGNYKANSNTLAASLVNCPLSNAFRMIVMTSDSSSYLLQFIFSRAASIYFRWGPSDGSNWRSWIKITTEST